MRVVLDTNVVLSGVVFGGVPGEVLAAWSRGRFEVVVSAAILACRWPLGSPHRWPVEVPAGGHGESPLVATGFPRRVVEVPHPLAGGGFLQAGGIAVDLVTCGWGVLNVAQLMTWLITNQGAGG